jgi:hypothetical protein
VLGVASEAAPAEIAPVPIRELARAHAETAFRVVVAIMTDRKVTPSTRLNAACEVLDRAWGKAITPSGDDDDQKQIQLAIIRRIIVDPGHSDEPGFHPADATGPV